MIQAFSTQAPFTLPRVRRTSSRQGNGLLAITFEADVISSMRSDVRIDSLQRNQSDGAGFVRG